MSTAPLHDITLDCIVRDFHGYIHRLALSILDDGNPGAAAEADDATQDIFLLAARGLPEFRGDASLKTWLTVISVNHCRGRLRKRRSWLRLLRRIVDQQPSIHRPESPEYSLSAEHAKKALWKAVDRLPDKQRIPVILFYVQELSTAEIGLTLNLPEGTVHSRLYHARRRLHDMLEQQDE
jgi:RNA polymerase sigma-70 factor (ECF subfamily)